MLTPAIGATLQSVEGSVLANTGSGYRAVGTGTPVSTGTQIMARGNGSASIVYQNGCIENVAPGTVVTVKPEGQCQAGLGTGALPSGALVAGAVVIAGGVGAAIALSKDDKPASP